MKIYFLITILLMGCGGSASVVQPGIESNGVELTGEIISSIKNSYVEIEKCTGLTGNFEELRIEILPDAFDCPFYKGKCAGLFEAYNLIKIAIFDYEWVPVLKEEYIHYLLYLNYGDPDQNEASGLFRKCI